MNSEVVPYKFSEIPVLSSLELWLRIFFPRDWVDAGYWGHPVASRKDYPCVRTFFDSMLSEVGDE